MNELRITDVRVLPGDSAFLIDDGHTAILYDSGFAFTGHQVAQNIARLLNGRKLDYIFLTHSHYDHALGSAYALSRWPDAKVVAGAYAARIFAKPTARAVMRELDGKFALENGVTQYEDLIDGLRVDIPVEDGDVIQAGDLRFTAVSMPGHTRCSVAYYEPARRLLLGCETPGVYDGDQTVVPCFLVGYQMTLDSIDRMMELDITQFVLPHLGLVSGDKAALYLQKARPSTMETAAEIVQLLQSGGTRKDAIRLFKDKFYHGRTCDTYPPAAMELNTGIMVDLIRRELMG